MNYFSQALRTLSRMPGYTALSLIGLVISLSGTIIITRYLHQGWTIDSWIPDRDRICLAEIKYMTDDGGPYTITANSERPLLEYEAVETVTRVTMHDLISVKLENEETFSVNGISADSNFVKVFPLKAIEGVLILAERGNVILSEELANKLFPGESPIGQTLKLDGNDIFTVTGVFRQPSSKSSLHYELVYRLVDTNKTILNCENFIFAKLRKGFNREDFNNQQLYEDPMKFDLDGSWFKSARFNLEPMNDFMRFTHNMLWPCINPPSSKNYLWMLFAVGVLLFFVGVFNFLNLYAVMRRRRTHEMQVRRIFGASKWNIFAQLYMECFVVSALAILGVWMVIEITTPHMKDWFAIEQITMPFFDTALSLSIMFILPLLATVRRPNPSRQGGEPSGLRKVNKAQPLPSLTGGAGGGSSFLFLQFFISITLITVSLYMMRQLHRMMKADPGFKTENVISCLPYLTNTYAYNRIKDERTDRSVFKQRLLEPLYPRYLPRSVLYP